MKNLECVTNGRMYTVSPHTMNKVKNNRYALELYDVQEQRGGYTFVFSFIIFDDFGEFYRGYKSVWQDRDHVEEAEGFMNYLMENFAIEKKYNSPT